MPARFSKRVVRALKLAYFLFPYEHESVTSVPYFEEALQIASLLHSEDEIIAALLRRVFSATKLNGSDLKAFGFSPAAITAIRLLDKPFMNMSLADGKEILANRLAEKVYWATVQIHRKRTYPDAISADYIKQCGVFCDVGDMVKAHLETEEPEFRLNNEEEAAELYAFLKHISTH